MNKIEVIVKAILEDEFPRAADLEDQNVSPYLPRQAEVAFVGSLTFQDGNSCPAIQLRIGSKKTEHYFAVEDQEKYRPLLGRVIPYNAREWQPFLIDTNSLTAPTTRHP